MFLWSKVLNYILEPSPNTGAVKLETKDEEGIVVEEPCPKAETFIPKL